MSAKPSILGNDTNKPNYARREYIEAAPDLLLLANELGGTRSMRAASADYIRKWAAEQKSNYDIRRNCESFFEGLGRTLSAAVGMVYAKPPEVDWNGSEAVLSPHADNIDSAGTAHDVFNKRFFEAAVRDGLCAILVDHTPGPIDDAGLPRVPTAEEEVSMNLRPIWARYERPQIINWRVETIGNRQRTTLAVLHEASKEPDGPFGVKLVHRFRELRLEPYPRGYAAIWRLWRLVKDDPGHQDAFVVEAAGTFTNRAGEIADDIPLAVGYAGRTEAPFTAVPPLMGVAEANLSHWQLSTDLRFNTLVAAFAQPTVIGELQDRMTPDGDIVPKNLEIGPLVVVHLKEGGDFKWTEAQGTGLERLEKLRDEKLQQIGTLGMSFLIPDTRAAETAEAKRIDASSENATLATAAQGVEDAVNMAWEYHAWYMGLEKTNAPVVTFNRDFEATAIQSDIMTAYVKAVKDAGLPPRIMLEAWQQGGRIAEDVDLDELEMEMLANAEAQAEREREEAEMRAAGARAQMTAL